MLDRTAVIGGSYENASGIFMRRACCEMHHYCFHTLCTTAGRSLAVGMKTLFVVFIRDA